MEKLLINEFKGVVGGQNERLGGEGIDITNLSYASHVYVVIASCGDGTP